MNRSPAIPTRPSPAGPLARLLLLGLLLAASVGCTSHARVRLESAQTDAVVRPALPTRVYTYSDPNTVDVFLTDLLPEQIVPGSGAVGHIVHVHMFLKPSPGRTPIDRTATNATIRHLILTGNQTGMYAGGGFLLPRGRPSSGHFGGSIRDASVVLLAGTDGFADLLGPSIGEVRFLARRDDALARRYQVALDRVAAGLRPDP